LSELIRLSKSVVGAEEKEALCRVVDAGYLGMGNEVAAFETEIRKYLETDMEVICVNTGTAALHLATLCLDIGPGDEVLIPSLTYVASFQAVSATGATPVACDVTSDTIFLDLKDAEKHLSHKTKAIMPVHYASDCSRINEVYAFATRHNIRVIEDAAHGFGSTRGGKKIGSEGDILCFSFDGIKNITSGEGGAVVTGDQKLAKRIKDARLLGVENDTEKRFQGKRSWSFDVKHQGYRYHMSDLMAAIGREQLRKIDIFSAHRQNCVRRYLEGLANLPGIQFLGLDYDNIVPHIFVVKILNNERAALRAYLRELNIESGIHYQPNHHLEYYQTEYTLPVTDKMGQEMLSLPLHADLTEAQQDRVIEGVKKFLLGQDHA
jgi:dTDP-4-amino-4,6-dideoxygalactose transaminase